MDKTEINNIIKKIISFSDKIEDKLAAPEIWKNFKDPFKVLITAIISIRVREETTIKVSEKFFNRFKTLEDIRNSSEDEIKEYLKNVGLYNQKAKWIKKIAEIWDYNKSCDEEYIRSLPGVGRKVANVYLNIVCNKNYIAVDSNVHRVLNRIGIVKTKNFEDTEKELYSLLDKEYWSLINYYLIKFGRNICKPLKPKCNICPIKEKCNYYKNKKE
ncbi:MAG: endonuclease III [Nanopusillaceae archaeon]